MQESWLPVYSTDIMQVHYIDNVFKSWEEKAATTLNALIRNKHAREEDLSATEI